MESTTCQSEVAFFYSSRQPVAGSAQHACAWTLLQQAKLKQIPKDMATGQCYLNNCSIEAVGCVKLTAKANQDKWAQQQDEGDKRTKTKKYRNNQYKISETKMDL